MKVNVVIYSEELGKKELQLLLQSIRDIEQSSSKDKKIGIAVFAPELSQEECQELLSSIKPGFPFVKAFKGGVV